MRRGSDKTLLVRLVQALALGPPSAGNLASPVFTRGSLQVEFYAPRGKDEQTPHERDEIYVVARGHGVFFDGRERHQFEPGTFIYVAAGQEHRFEELSDDFAVWVVFYGPEGGERTQV